MTNRKSKITAKVIQLIMLIILIYLIFILISKIQYLNNTPSQDIHLKTAETIIAMKAGNLKSIFVESIEEDKKIETF